MKGWTYKGDADGVVSLRGLPGLRAEVEKACQTIAERAAAETGGVTGEWQGFDWKLPAGYRWEVHKVAGRTGYVASVIANHPSPRGRRAAHTALRRAARGA